MRDLSKADVALLALAIFMPPLAVFIKEFRPGHLALSIVLCMTFWIPGVIHAFWYVLREQ